MNKQTIVKPRNDHIRQWVALKRLYMRKRGSDAGRNRKAIPRTTNGDVRQLVRYWHGEYLRELIGNPVALDRDKASRRRWQKAKQKIDRRLARTDGKALYPENEWFWDTATSKLSIYLESRKAVPNRATLIVESIRETAAEHVEAAGNLVKAAGDAVGDVGDKARSLLRTGAWIVGGAVAAAIVIPPVIRAFKD